MLEAKTVFILGAGASFDFQFPIGDALLRTNIRDLLRTKDFFSSCFAVEPDFFANEEIYNTARVMLFNALGHYPSIDNLLHVLGRKEFFGEYIVRIGKRAIASCILDAEKKSHLAVSPRSLTFNHEEKVEDSWLGRLSRMLGVNASPETVFENLVFVTFNYDRSVEQYFRHAIARQFAIDLDEADEICKTLPIYHVYGSLGPLTGTSGDVTAFGDTQPISIQRAAAAIRTFTEECHSEQITEIHYHLSQADRVMILGFGFHELNMRLIAPSMKMKPNVSLYATTLGHSQPDRAAFERMIAEMWTEKSRGGGFSTDAGWDCSGIFREYALTWSR